MKTVDEVVTQAARLRQSLRDAGDLTSAARLDDVLTNFWTTSSEFLFELLNVLEETRATWEAGGLDINSRLGAALMTDARELLKFE
jgi:hypothetical protein